MKKLISSVIIAISMAVSSISVNAQTTVTTADWINTAPIIPLPALVKGRQGVAKNLMLQFGHAEIQYGGQSIVAAPGMNHMSLWPEDLARLGYIHAGMFSELSDALANMDFYGQVIPTPQGYYDVNAQVVYYTADNRIAMSGYGNVQVVDDGHGGLTGGTFQPCMTINEQLAVRIPGNIQAVKWIAKIWGQGQDLQYSFDGVNTLILVQASMLQDGFLAYTDMSGDITAWDLSAGGILLGKQLLVFLGQSNSSDIRRLRNPSTFDAGDAQFFQDNGYIFGRFPLTDLVTDQPMRQAVSPVVPVWGAGYQVMPSHIYFTPIYFIGPNSTGYTVGVEYPLPYNDQLGAWILSIPAGGYQIRVVFDNVFDWENDPWAKG